MKKTMLIVLWVMIGVGCYALTLWAGDSTLKLDSADGSSNFVIQDSGATQWPRLIQTELL